MLAVLLLGLLPLVATSGEGNIHILEDDVAKALKACVNPKNNQRQQRSTQYRVVGTGHQDNQYGHERRNTSDLKERMHVLNATDYDYEGFGGGNAGEQLVSSVPRTRIRSRRGDPLVAKTDPDQCLSQCIFANMQVVDVRGIPREAELWARVQAAVTSQQSRAALRDQLHACFQELQSEAEDDGCSYSDKIENCMQFRFADRRVEEPRAAD